jgi:hypothetical protein
LSVPSCSTIFPTTFCSFKISGFILKFSIHIQLIPVQGERHGSRFSFLQADIQFSQQHLLSFLLRNK